jgi:hypothetical protein
MRSVLVSAILASIVAVTGLAIPVATSRLTVVMDFKGPWSPPAAREMQKESARILGRAGVRIDWKLRGESLSGNNTSNLVVMTFHGSCQFDSQPPIYDELGPYASTHETNGEVQPFGDVDCARVVSSARYAMTGSDFERQDYLVGRALGRVVAHELVHMVTRSQDHAHEGVQKAALSGRELIGAPLPLELAEVSQIRRAIAASQFQK